MKKGLAVLLALTMLCGVLTACGGKETEIAAQETEEDEDYTTGDASLDNPRNQDEIGEKELLVVSFGTSYNDSRRETIGAIEDALAEAFPDWSVRRAFTSQIIIDHVKNRDGEVIDNVTEALERAVNNGVKQLVVQPTHLMDGYEYHDLAEELARYADAFERVEIGAPLLTTEGDFHDVAAAVAEAMAGYDDGETAIVLMGHGTEAESNRVYEQMQGILDAEGLDNYFIGTVEAFPSVEDVLAAVQIGNYKRAVLRPLMVVAGDHANNDMAGDEEDSWKSIFEAAGYEVECVLEGLGSVEAIQKLYVAHAKEAIVSLDDTSAVADASQMTTVERVGSEGMTPVFASALVDGVYNIKVDSSSSMFKIADCELTVGGGAMTVKLIMSSDSYGYLYPGTAEQAAAASAADYIAPVLENGVGTFTFPLAALDQATDCAAWSRSKELWYDRTLVFRSDSLPAAAFADGEAVTAGVLGLADGPYVCNVTLGGGSGKASVDEQAFLLVKDGAVTAQITWSSANYDYMLVDGVRYDAEIGNGHSVFTIPVTAFDRPLAVVADTTAMSKPYEIDYTLTFDSATLQVHQW